MGSLIIDSQRGRNVRVQMFNGDVAAYRAVLRDRVSDARRGFDWLAATGWADPQRLLLFGESQGGAAGLVAATDGELRVPQVLFYPPCGQLQKTAGLGAYPRSLWILAEYDEMAPAKDCIAMWDDYFRAGAPASSIQAVTIPRAHHAFDIPMTQPAFFAGNRLETSP
jgi:dienelactone hydrolase